MTPINDRGRPTDRETDKRCRIKDISAAVAVARALRSAGKTQAEVAEYLGVDQSWVSRHLKPVEPRKPTVTPTVENELIKAPWQRKRQEK